MKTVYAKAGRVRAIAFPKDPAHHFDYGDPFPVADSFAVQIGDSWPPEGFKVASGLVQDGAARPSARLSQLATMLAEGRIAPDALAAELSAIAATLDVPAIPA